MIIVIAEHQHIKNDYICDFCEDKARPVVGRAYKMFNYDYPKKHYLFAYCAKCGIDQAEKLARLVHPNYRVEKIAVQSNKD